MIAIIPARGGSRRIPRKNIKLFHDKPILAYSILLAKEANLFNRIVVSTEDTEIAAIATEYGAEVHERPSELAEDEIGTQEVVGAVLRDLGVTEYACACALYATAPLLTTTDLLDGYRVHSHTTAGCVYSADYQGEPSGGFYIALARFFWDGRDPYTEGVGLYTPDIDIDTLDDWTKAEELYGNKGSMGW